MEGEWMRGDTHSDMERWKTCWGRHLVITKRGDSWLGPNPPSTRKIYLSLRLQTSSLSSFLSLYLPESKGWWLKGGKREGWREKKKTLLIYMPLSNWDCILLSCAIVYCVWLSNEKKEQRRDELAAEPSKLLSVHWWLSALTNLVT